MTTATTELPADAADLLQDAYDALQSAAHEPCDPATSSLIDAGLALHAYLKLLPAPQPPQQPDRESILTDPKAIAERHGVNVGLLSDRLDTVHRDGIHLSQSESLFLMDLLQALGFE